MLEQINNYSNNKKIHNLIKDIEKCEEYIEYLEKNLVSHVDEIDQLKAELQFTLQEVEKCKYHLELKEEALLAQDSQIIKLEDTVNRLRAQIYKVTANISKEMNNPLLEILGRRQNLSDIITDVRVFLDRSGIQVPQNIENILNASAGELDEIIRQANLLQEFCEDQGNQVEGFQELLDEANDRIQVLRNDLNNSRTEINRLNRVYNIALNERQQLQDVVQNQQAQIANQQGQIANQQGQIANQQGQIAEYRRNAHRLTVRYNDDAEEWRVRYNNNTERWRQRHRGCIQQARN